jgi:hypothetical protein
MAWMIFMPLTPLMSLNTLLSCMFISVNTFCMRCTTLLASATKLPRCRHSVRAIRISSLG